MPISRVLSATAFAAFLGSGAAAPAHAQTSSAALKFEVASIKPSDPGVNGRSIGWVSPGRFAARQVTVRSLLLLAYRVSNSQVGDLPGWVNTEFFDIDAKSDFPAKGGDLIPMLQALLIDRFGLRVRKEARELAAFELVIAKGGPKLREVGAGAIQNQSSSSGGSIIAGVGLSMRNLVSALTSHVGRVVVDNTGLTGYYELKLEWTPEPAPALMPGTAPGSLTPTDPTGPSIFTALREQLGLELRPGKQAVDFLIVDGIERPNTN